MRHRTVGDRKMPLIRIRSADMLPRYCHDSGCCLNFYRWLYSIPFLFLFFFLHAGDPHDEGVSSAYPWRQRIQASSKMTLSSHDQMSAVPSHPAEYVPPPLPPSPSPAASRYITSASPLYLAFPLFFLPFTHSSRSFAFAIHSHFFLDCRYRSLISSPTIS